MTHPIGRLLLAAAVAALPALAHADSTADTAPNGVYTYVFGLPNSASFTLVHTPDLGNPNGTTLSGTPSGNPTGDVSYSFDNYTEVGDNSTWTEIQLQWTAMDQLTPNQTDYYSFTFTELDSFWAQTSFTGALPTDGPTYTGVLYYDDNTGPQFGTVSSGAFYGTYTGATSLDPACDSCTVNTSFVPATPEPSSLALLGTGGAAVLGFYRRRRRLL
jgi:hypothetical protein